MGKPSVIISIASLFLISCAVGDFSEIEAYDTGDNNYPVYSVMYDGNGSTTGTVPVDTGSYEYGDSVLISGVTASLRGPSIQDGITQRFICWNSESDGSGTTYYPGNTLIFPGYDITLYAAWTVDAAVTGKTGPAGGLVFYDNLSVNAAGWRYMEAAPKASEIYGKVFQSSNFFIGTSSAFIGSGRDNTLLLSQWLSANGQYDTAGWLCYDMSAGGYADWFLPSQNEMAAIRDTLYTAGIGSFEIADYTTSTEYDYAFIWSVKIPSGINYFSKTSNTVYTRPARAFRSDAETYSVIYNSNTADSGSAPADPYHYELYNNANILPEGSLVKSGYAFSGWNTMPDGSGANYMPGISLNMGAGSDVVLYANWSPAYNVTYDMNFADGGFPPADASFYAPGDFVTVLDNYGGLTRTGFTFNGWNTAPDGTGTNYMPFESFNMPPYPLVLFARWI